MFLSVHVYLLTYYYVKYILKNNSADVADDGTVDGLSVL